MLHMPHIKKKMHKVFGEVLLCWQDSVLQTFNSNRPLLIVCSVIECHILVLYMNTDTCVYSKSHRSSLRICE